MQTKSKVKSQNSKTKSKLIKGLLLTLCSLLFTLSSNAQCAMCRASLESSGESQKVEAVNDGIVYLMAIPYILVGLIGVVIYRMYFGKKE